MLIIAVCLVGLSCRSARQIGLSVLPTASPLVGVVGTAVDAPIAGAADFVRGLPQMAVAHSPRLLANRRVASVHTITIDGHGIDFRRVVSHTSIEHQRVGVAQLHGSQMGSIILACQPLHLCIAIELIHESRLDGHVEHVLLLAVRHACPFLELALLVVSLDVLHSLNGQHVRQHGFAECLLSVHHQLQRFTVPKQFALLHAHAWQLLNQLHQPCAILRLESIGVEHHRVATHIETAHSAFHRHFAQQMLIHLQSDVVYHHRVAVVVAHSLHFLAMIAEVFCLDGHLRQLHVAGILEPPY